MEAPQTPIALVNFYINWVTTNIINNLDYIPEDKLDWKPAPKAKSVYEIVNHFTGVVAKMTSSITGQPEPKLAEVSTKAEAKQLIQQVSDAHLDAINALTPEQMQETTKTPAGEIPKGAAAGLPVVELLNHHGQITYIQTLLGDDESHMVF